MMQTEKIAAEIYRSLSAAKLAQVESSARHAHLCAKDMETLFGKGARLTPKRMLSQKGEFLSEERVTVISERRTIQNVAILGPLRPESQVELSLTDGVSLGLKLPVRISGDIAGTPGIILCTEIGEARLDYGCIAAMRHLHAAPAEAAMLGLVENQLISVEVFGSRKVVFNDMPVRIKDSFRLRVHLDMDEANAAGLDGFTLGRLIY